MPETTTDLLRRHRVAQVAQRLILGSLYQDQGLVIAREDGNPVHPAWLSKAFSALAKRCGMTDVHFHCLRHTAASLMLASGVPMKVASEALGHSNHQITADIYSHVTAPMHEDAARKVDTLLRGVLESGLKSA